jgi:hypothetical protein
VNVADVHMTGMEMLQNFGQAKTEAVIEADPAKKQELAKWMPGGENYPKLMDVYMPIHMRYMNDLVKLGSSQEYLQELDDLAVKYHDNKLSAEYGKEFFALRDKYAPNLANMNKELHEVAKKLGLPGDFDWGSPRS